MTKEKIKRLNIYFRQTAKEFRAARQNQVFNHINRNLPYTVFKFSRKVFSSQVKKIKGSMVNFREKLPR